MDDKFHDTFELGNTGLKARLVLNYQGAPLVIPELAVDINYKGAPQDVKEMAVDFLREMKHFIEDSDYFRLDPVTKEQSIKGALTMNSGDNGCGLIARYPFDKKSGDDRANAQLLYKAVRQHIRAYLDTHNEVASEEMPQAHAQSIAPRQEQLAPRLAEIEEAPQTNTRTVNRSFVERVEPAQSSYGVTASRLMAIAPSLEKHDAEKLVGHVNRLVQKALQAASGISLN